jgi:hypothetical protein
MWIPKVIGQSELKNFKRDFVGTCFHASCRTVHISLLGRGFLLHGEVVKWVRWVIKELYCGHDNGLAVCGFWEMGGFWGLGAGLPLGLTSCKVGGGGGVMNHYHPLCKEGWPKEWTCIEGGGRWGVGGWGWSWGGWVERMKG